MPDLAFEDEDTCDEGRTHEEIFERILALLKEALLGCETDSTISVDCRRAELCSTGWRSLSHNVQQRWERVGKSEAASRKEILLT